MPTPRSLDLGELAITAVLLSIYAGARGTARALGIVQGLTRRTGSAQLSVSSFAPET